MQNPSGMTLSELLVSTTLIGIVMIGVASFTLAVKDIQERTHKASILTMRLTSAMSRIRQDFDRAVGDPSDPGFAELFDNSTGEQTFCIRFDVNNPASYADDLWICYHIGASRLLSRFIDVDDSVVPCVWTDCVNQGTQDLSYAIGLSNATTLADKPFSVVTSGGRFDHIAVNLKIRFDSSQTAVPLENPEYTLTGEIRPPGIVR